LLTRRSDAVVIRATSTIEVNPAGSTWATASSSSSGVNTVALGAGLGAGLGIPLLIAIAVLVWFMRKRKIQASPGVSSESEYQPPSGPQEMAQPANVTRPPPAQSPFQRKPLSTSRSATSSPPTAVSPISPLHGPELPGQDARTEMPGLSGTPELGAAASLRSGTTLPGPPPYELGRSGLASPQQSSGRWVWTEHGPDDAAGQSEGRWELPGST
jgi:hypothetical protein